MRRATIAMLVLMLGAACRTQPLSATAPRDLAPVGDLAAAVDAGCDGGLNACGECGPTPEEECNGRDDDCDGIVDEGCARRIDAAQLQPATRLRIGGDHAIYIVGTAIPYTPTKYEIWTVDLRDGKRALLASSVGFTPTGLWDSFDGIDTDGSWGVWLHTEGGTKSIEALSFSTGTRRTITLDSSNTTTEPSVTRGQVTLGAQFDTHVRTWDLATNMLAENVALSGNPKVVARDGDWLVAGFAGSPVAARARRYSDGKVVELSTVMGTADLRAVDLDGTLAVVQSASWPDAGYVTELRVADLAAGTNEVIAPELGGTAPRVSGSLVCFVARDQGIWVYDASTGRKLRVASRGTACDITGRRVAWIAASSDGLAFVRELAPSEP